MNGCLVLLFWLPSLILCENLGRYKRRKKNYIVPINFLRSPVLFLFFLKAFILFLCHDAWHVGSEFPVQGSNPWLLHWKCGVLTTWLSGKSPVIFENHLLTILFFQATKSAFCFCQDIQWYACIINFGSILYNTFFKHSCVYSAYILYFPRNKQIN